MRRNQYSQQLLTRLNSLKSNREIKKYLKPVGLIIALVLLVVFTRRLLVPKGNDTAAKAPKLEQSLSVGSGFNIPINDSGDSISFNLTSAELTKDIILKGQEASAIDGRNFLILNLKLSNQLKQRIKIDTRDYVRLSHSDSPDRLAPQIYNDPVEVQPISDQYTRIGFSVPDTSNNFKLYVGEITSDKTEIDLNFN